MNWIEYLNGKGDTYYAELRRKHGHCEPYDVKYVGLGNEMWGPWQIGQLSALEYAQKARRWAKAIKLIDPSIKLVSCGKEGNDEVSCEVRVGTTESRANDLWAATNFQHSGTGSCFESWST